jgi:hypothetical protein
MDYKRCSMMGHPVGLWFRLGILIASVCVAASAHALSLEQAKRIAIGESDARVAAIATAQP